MLLTCSVVLLSLLFFVSTACSTTSAAIPRLHQVLRDGAQHRRADDGSLPPSPFSFSVPLQPNLNYAPSELQLLTDSILRYGTFKNAHEYPLLRSHLDVLGLLDTTLGFAGDVMSPLLPLVPTIQRKGLLDRLLPLEIDLGAETTPKKELLGAGIKLGGVVQISLSAKRTLIDPGWDNATSSSLVNSQSDTAVSTLPWAARNLKTDFSLGQWFASIGFGSPQQVLEMFIDSGSADTVVFNHSCASCQLNNHTAFDNRKSLTWKPGGKRFSTAYGDGTTFSGSLGQDNVRLSTALQACQQTIAVIDTRRGATSHRWDGILGIGPDQLSFVVDNITPPSNLIKAGKLAQPLVGIALVRNAGGEYRWGAVNNDYLAGDLVNIPVTSSYFWGTNTAGVYINGMQVEAGWRAIYDTGTTLIYTSDKSAQRIHDQIRDSEFDKQRGFWYIPCDNITPVSFEIGGQRWIVSSSDLAFRKSSTGNGLCMSGIQGGSEEFTILGAMFIKNIYLVLNYGNAKQYELSIGLGKRKDVS